MFKLFSFILTFRDIPKKISNQNLNFFCEYLHLAFYAEKYKKISFLFIEF